MVEDDDVRLVESISGNMLKLRCSSLQLYKCKLYLGNHTVELQSIGVFCCK